MNVLSLFDGLSGAKVALDRLNIKHTYYASEIDKYSESVSRYNYPDIIRLGDVTKIKGKDLPKIDLLIGGSPCQGFSVAGHRKGWKDHRSQLFFEYVRLLKECKPTYFVLENVRMKQQWVDMISNELRTEPILINSALLTAQNRQRFYWTNFPVGQPEDKGIILKDIIEEGITDRDKSYCIDASYFKGGNLPMYFNKNKRQLVFGDWSSEKEKSYAITATYGNAGNLNDYFKRNKRQLVFCLTEGRTEEAKDLRKESRREGKDSCPRRAKELVPRTDDKVGCLTTSLTKEHLIVDGSIGLITKEHGFVEGKYEENAEKYPSLCAQSPCSKHKITKPMRIGEIGRGSQGQRIYSEEGKSVTLNAHGGGQGAKMGLYAIAQKGRYEEGEVKQRYEISGEDKSNALTTVQKDSMIAEQEENLILVRKLTPIECERLQGLEDNFTLYGIDFNGKKIKISNTQRYRMIGNGFTAPVIQHILKEVLCSKK